MTGVEHPVIKKRMVIVAAGAVWAAGLFVQTGCGGGADFGLDVSVPQSRQHRVEWPGNADGLAILPPDRPFNVADAQRQSDGAASASSSASPEGSASCVADASHGGSASAGFQVGHVLAYHGSTSLGALVTFDVAYVCRLEAYEARYGNGPIRLKAYVMDSDRRLLGEVMLAASDPDRLPTSWSGSQAPSFDVTFEPGVAYHLIVAGHVEVSGVDTTGPRASLSVTSVDIRVIPAPG